MFASGGAVSIDAKTIAFYDTAAQRYADLTGHGHASKALKVFMALLPVGAEVLDLGCGPARASVHMRDAGFRPDPIDASVGMVTLANEAHQIGARLLTFDEIDMVAAYDGVWANFSLLHAPAQDLPRHLRAIATALRDGGVLHIAMKIGTGTQRDGIDRLYSYVSVAELDTLLTQAGFDVIATQEGREVGCAGTNDPFVAMQARKHA
jgi:SAM-dependent methyltransferase